MRCGVYGLCFKLYTNYTQNYTLRRSKPYTNYTRKPIVIHAECAFGAAVAALSRHQVIFSRRPVTPTSRFVTYRGAAVSDETTRGSDEAPRRNDEAARRNDKTVRSGVPDCLA